MPISNNVLEKATLSVPKLQGQEDWCCWLTTMQITLDHTWDYVAGGKTDIPDQSDPGYASWVIEDCNAHQGIWLALSENVQDTVILHATSPASVLFHALKLTYEFSSVTAKYYAHLNYDNAKVSDYDSLGDYITGLTNLAYLVNKEIEGTDGHIQQWHIAMRIIHSLPHSMCTLQTILIESAPTSSTTDWDLASLKLCIVADECQACAAGELLRTKLDASCQLNALAAEGVNHQVKRHDPNDPMWLS